MLPTINALCDELENFAESLLGLPLEPQSTKVSNIQGGVRGAVTFRGFSSDGPGVWSAVCGAFAPFIKTVTARVEVWADGTNAAGRIEILYDHSKAAQGGRNSSSISVIREPEGGWRVRV